METVAPPHRFSAFRGNNPTSKFGVVARDRTGFDAGTARKTQKIQASAPRRPGKRGKTADPLTARKKFMRRKNDLGHIVF